MCTFQVAEHGLEAHYGVKGSFHTSQLELGILSNQHCFAPMHSCLVNNKEL